MGTSSSCSGNNFLQMDLPIFVVCCVIMGLSVPFLYGANSSFQEKGKPEYLGRVFSFDRKYHVTFVMPIELILSMILC